MILGQRFMVEADEIPAKLEFVKPDTTALSRYFVTINGREFPAKQVISVVTGQPVAFFTSVQAIRFLGRCGYAVTAR
jgi:hypothetical protein